MKPHVRRRKYASYKSGLVLLGVLVVFWILVTNINKSGIPAGLAGLINSDYENFRGLEQFDSAKAEEAQRHIAGFWVYAEGDPEKSPVAKREYMELIDNGILWMVKVWDINTPSGERHTLTHVIYGYVSPYSYNRGGSAYYCQTRVIRQVHIYDGDTCHGASQADEIWEVEITAAGNNDGSVDTVNGNVGALTVNRREYRPYTGDIKAFFPDSGLLGIVDKVSIGFCPAAVNLSLVSKKLLTRSMDAVPFFARAGMVDSLIHSYYKPMVLDELSRRYDPRAVPNVMDIKMTISSAGVVASLKYRGAKVVTKRFDDLAVMDMKSWLYPAVGDSQESQTVEIAVRVK